mgnify:CR=1 FL=1
MILIDHTSGDNFGDRAMLAGVCKAIAAENLSSRVAPRGSMDTFFRDFE